MSLEFLSPVSEIVAAHVALLPDQSLGKQIKVHTSDYGVPDLDDVDLAVIGVRENRNDIDFLGEDLYFDTIRKSLYDLFPIIVMLEK